MVCAMTLLRLFPWDLGSERKKMACPLKSCQLASGKKVGTKAWIEEKPRGGNPDPKCKK
jgi:hypothetical protein